MEREGIQGREQPLPVPFDVAKRVNRNFSPLFSRSQPRLPFYLFYLSITLVCLQQVRKVLPFISPGPLNPEMYNLFYTWDLLDTLPVAPVCLGGWVLLSLSSTIGPEEKHDPVGC